MKLSNVIITISVAIMANHYTKIVFQNGIEIREKDNYKFLIATRDITIGELLVIEHAFVTDFSNMFNVVSMNEYLFDQYHPRTTKWCNVSGENRHKEAEKKVKCNSFCYDANNGLTVETDFIAKCNHSCDPNCAISPNRPIYIFDTIIGVYMELYAVKNISHGTEIMISYGPETGHQRDFTCGCGFDLKKREQISEATISMAGLFFQKNEAVINDIINRYQSTPEARIVMLYQYLAQKYIFVNNHQIVAADERVGKHFILRVIRFNSTKDEKENPKEIFLKYMRRQFLSKDLVFG